MSNVIELHTRGNLSHKFRAGDVCTVFEDKPVLIKRILHRPYDKAAICVALAPVPNMLAAGELHAFPLNQLELISR